MNSSDNLNEYHNYINDFSICYKDEIRLIRPDHFKFKNIQNISLLTSIGHVLIIPGDINENILSILANSKSKNFKKLYINPNSLDRKEENESYDLWIKRNKSFVENTSFLSGKNYKHIKELLHEGVLNIDFSLSFMNSNEIHYILTKTDHYIFDNKELDLSSSYINDSFFDLDDLINVLLNLKSLNLKGNKITYKSIKKLTLLKDSGVDLICDPKLKI